MIGRLSDSIAVRVLSALRRFLSALFDGSVVIAACRDCALARLLRRWVSASAPLGDTLSAAASRRLARAAWLDRTVGGSGLARLWHGFCRITRSSRLFGWIFCDGITGVLLTVIGLYAGIDWLLRDAVTVPMLSSVWDELWMLICALWLWRQAAADGAAHTPRPTVLGYFVFLFLTLGLMLIGIVSPYLNIAVSGYRAQCQYLLWYFIVLRLLRGDKDAKRLYGLSVALALVIALHGVYQYIVAVPIPAKWVDAAEQSVRTRVFSIFGSPNIMADYMVIFAPMCAALAYHAKKPSHRLLAWCAAGLCCVSCLFTMSRGGWAAMAVAIVIFAILVDRRLLGALLIAAVCSLALPFVASRIGYLFTDEFTHANSSAGREARWAIGMQYLQNSSPLFGYGLGMFGGAVAMQHKIYDHVYYFYLDNYYMKTLVEMGYLGLGAFLAMLASLFATGCRCLARAKKAESRSAYAPMAGIFAGLCGVMAHCYFENIFEEPYMMAVFWTLAALMTYLGTYRKSS